MFYRCDENVLCGDGSDNIFMCRKILNTYSGKRMISRAEACVLVSLNMELTKCSENIEEVGISQYFRIVQNKEAAKKDENIMVRKYANRLSGGNNNNSDGNDDDDDDNDGAQGGSEDNHDGNPDKQLSLCTFFNHEKERMQQNAKEKKIYIPHFTGLNFRPVYPPTVEYAQGTMIIHKPWHKHDAMKFNKRSAAGRKKILQDFHDFIHSDTCPERVKVQYALVKYAYQRKRAFTEVQFSAQDPYYKPTSIDSEDDEIIQHYDKLSATTKKLTKSISGVDCAIGRDFNWNRGRKSYDDKYNVSKLGTFNFLY